MTEKLGGVLCVYKAQGCTSHDVVNKVRRLFNTKQVGHTGTLDPMAQGVLVIMVGRAVKASELLASDTKEYAAGMKLGITTDTEDISGHILTEFSGAMPDFETVKKAVLSFVGEIQQIPPMYSALKVDGKKLVDLARKGVEVQRSPRTVCVDKIEVYPTENANEFMLNTRVSKGTYIRTLCADIGQKLGTGAVMSSLTRTVCGSFGIEGAVKIEELEKLSEKERYALLLPIESLFDDCGCVHLAPFFARLAACGCEIYQKKIGTDFPTGTLIRLYDENGFFAMGRVFEFEKGSAIKPIKQFKI